MDILPANFTVLRFCGTWWENEEKNFVLRLLQYLYRYSILAVMYHFTLCEVIELVRIRNNIEELTEGMFLTFTFVALCFKLGNFVIRKREIEGLLNNFRSEVCLSRTETEKAILDKYGTKAKRCTYFFMTMSQLAGISLLVAPVVASKSPEKTLPLMMYIPYSTSGLLPYIATFLEQIASLTYGVWLNVSLDSLVYGFTIRTCGQIELLYHRLGLIFNTAASQTDNRLEEDKQSMIRLCVRHHLVIHDIVRRIQSLFVWIVTILFFFSLITLCTSIFRMSKQSILSIEFLSLLTYLSSMLIQIFFYCWYGNDLELKSKGVAEAVYFSHWTNGSVKMQKSLLILMTISQKGLNLSCYGIFALSLNTFTWILKTSYSSFNLLQQMSN